MKLTTEQKQFIGEVYEKALTVADQFQKGEIRVCFGFDERREFVIRVYNTGSSWKRLAGDDLWVIKGKTVNNEVLNAIDDIAEYAANVTVNQKRLLSDKIAALQKELEALKKAEA